MRNRNINILPPQDNSYLEWLRYLVQSSDPGAGELPFLVGVWSCALHNKGLTEGQQTAVQPYIDEAALFLNTFVYDDEIDDEEAWDQTNLVHFPDKTGGA